MQTLEEILEQQFPPVGHLQCDEEDVIDSVEKYLKQYKKHLNKKIADWGQEDAINDLIKGLRRSRE